MGLFRRKTEEEEDLDEYEIKPKKIRDLKPENRKVRKEPPKPWGKFERLVVLFTFLFTVITALFLVLYSKGYRIPKIDLPSFDFSDKRTIIIER